MKKIELPGKIIVLEGVDCSGKSTVADFLTRHIENATLFRFSGKQAPFNTVIERAHTSKEVADWALAEAAFAIEKRLGYPHVLDVISHQKNGCAILDRWWPAQLVYGKQHDVAGCDFSRDLFWGHINILLAPSRGVLYGRLNRQGGPRDSYESDMDATMKRQARYLELWEKKTDDGRLRCLRAPSDRLLFKTITANDAKTDVWEYLTDVAKSR